MKRHEDIQDVNIRRIFRIAVAMIVIGAVIHLAVWWMFTYYRVSNEERDVRQTLIETPPPIPPEPRLEVNPTQDFQTYHRMQQEVLNSYGWTSREQGRVHVPIEEAMKVVVANGLNAQEK